MTAGRKRKTRLPTSTSSDESCAEPAKVKHAYMPDGPELAEDDDTFISETSEATPSELVHTLLNLASSHFGSSTELVQFELERAGFNQVLSACLPVRTASDRTDPLSTSDLPRSIDQSLLADHE